MKKILSLTIIALMALMLFPVISSANSSYTEWTDETTLPTTAGQYKLTKDVTITNKVTIGAWSGSTTTVTLDLNGHTVKFVGNSAQYYIQNSGALIIEDSVGTGLMTNAEATSQYMIYAKGSLQINGGTIENTLQSCRAVYIQGETKEATCILNGGTIKNSFDKSGRAVVIGSKATFTMNGGKVENKASGTAGTVPAIEGGKITIAGGTIESAGTGVYSTVAVEITGGTIEADWFALETRDANINPAEGKKVDISAGKAVFKAMSKVSSSKGNRISGGNFDAPELVAAGYSLDETNAEVSGGNFTADVSEYLDENAIYTEDEDGNMTVFVPVELDKPANLKWDETTAKWDAVSNATGYTVMLYNGTEIVEVFSLKDTKLDLSKYLTKEDGKYNFAVFAEGDGKAYLDSQVAASEVYVFPTSEGGEGPAEQQPAEDKKEEKDETPKTGAFDMALYVLGAIALVSVVGTVKAKKTGKYSK